MQNDIFNNRPLFYSEQFDYNSNFLLDFKKFNLKLNYLIIGATLLIIAIIILLIKY